VAAIPQPQKIEALAAEGDEYAACGGQLKPRPVLGKMPIHRRLMKADLTRAPAIVPELGLH
jgi:hypothetical protein